MTTIAQAQEHVTQLNAKLATIKLNSNMLSQEDQAVVADAEKLGKDLASDLSHITPAPAETAKSKAHA